jgi:hypothetical protein
MASVEEPQRLLGFRLFEPSDLTDIVPDPIAVSVALPRPDGNRS